MSLFPSFFLRSFSVHFRHLEMFPSLCSHDNLVRQQVLPFSLTDVLHDLLHLCAISRYNLPCHLVVVLTVVHQYHARRLG